MCTSDLCNANDYNFHTERANRLFGRPQTSEAVRSPFFPPTSSRSRNTSSSLTSSVSSSSSRNSKVTVVTPSSNLVEDDIIEDEDVSTQEVDIVKVHDR